MSLKARLNRLEEWSAPPAEVLVMAGRPVGEGELSALVAAHRPDRRGRVYIVDPLMSEAAWLESIPNERIH